MMNKKKAKNAAVVLFTSVVSRVVVWISTKGRDDRTVDPGVRCY